MNDDELLTAHFEAHRGHLRAVAYRMLGSVSEAEDAVQEAWLRLHRAGAGSGDIGNLAGWLTTVVGRVCLDMLRSRRTRREEPLAEPGWEREPLEPDEDPEEEAMLADSVGLALLVVLETLDPAERLAFVLHDMFAVPFEEIATILGRSPGAARQLASRARRRVQGGAAPVPEPDLALQRRVVDAFLAAARGGDFEALVAVLDPDVVAHSDAPGAAAVVRGAEAVARGAMTFTAFSRVSQPALVDGRVGVIAAAAPPGGHRVASFTFAGARIATITITTTRAGLRDLQVAVLP